MTAFVYGGALNPIRHRDIIIHRAELDCILEHIENQDLYIILKNARQTGKTTLLYQIQARLHGNGYGVVYLDFSGLDNLREAEFYQKIASNIQDQLKDIIENTNITPLDSENIVSNQNFSEYLKYLAACTPQARKLVFMIDEVGSVPENISLFPTLRSFFHQGRGMADDSYLYQKVMFIFTGTLEVTKLMEGKNSPLYNICKPFTLNDFSKEQVAQLGQKLQDFPPDNIDIIVDKIYEWCGGHPYLTQRLFALIDENQECRNASNQEITQIVDQVIETYILDGNDVNVNHIFHYLQGQESPKSYRDAVFKILNNKKPRKTVAHQDDLLTVGIIKRSNLYLEIRNKMYKMALNNFFDQETKENDS